MKKFVKAFKWAVLAVLLLLAAGLCFPTWTPGIPGENSISELRQVEVNGVALEVMIRGADRDNPVLLFVHGGPCCSEIPYVRRYQEKLEDQFTVVHYDQRGSGKSYHFGTDYSGVTAADHVNDLVALTLYIEDYLKQEQVILAGHSYGTYLAAMAAAREPKLYCAYVGIGQMSDTAASELDGLQKCIRAAQEADAVEEAAYLRGLEPAVANGESITPRKMVRKYGFAARGINEDADYLSGFLLGSEYNLLDMLRFYMASSKYQDALIMEALNNPLPELVQEIELPVYFVMGKYDAMTSPEAAADYLDRLKGNDVREMVLFEESAHYPQFEEKERFFQWMCETFQ